MALTAYMTATGEKQGDIKGSNDQAGHEDTMMVKSIDHQVNIPTDRLSGRATGARVHGPFTIVKEVDKATPLLYQALCEGETLTKIEVKNFRIAKSGSEEHFFTTTLENAIIVSIKPRMAPVDDPSTEGLPFLEEISFRYAKVEWRHEIDSTNFTDSWKGDG